MSFGKAGDIVAILAAAILVIRLTTLSLHRVYHVFCIYLYVDLAITIFALVASSSNQQYYFEAWLISRVVCWICYLFIVYDLLDGILASFTGILRFSQRFVVWVFCVVVVVSALSIKPEYVAGGIAGLLGGALVIERYMCTVEFLVLASILGFLRLFPIDIPRNLRNLSLGFLVYFGAKSFLLLVRSFVSHSSYGIVAHVISLLATCCYIFWILAVSPGGEKVPVSLNDDMPPGERERALNQLASVNAALMRSGKPKIAQKSH